MKRLLFPALVLVAAWFVTACDNEVNSSQPGGGPANSPTTSPSPAATPGGATGTM